jgi:hypothetical protein
MPILVATPSSRFGRVKELLALALRQPSRGILNHDQDRVPVRLQRMAIPMRAILVALVLPFDTSNTYTRRDGTNRHVLPPFEHAER